MKNTKQTTTTTKQTTNNKQRKIKIITKQKTHTETNIKQTPHNIKPT